MLLAALYGGLAVGQRIVAYRQRTDAPSPSHCGSFQPPEQQFVSAHRHHHRGQAAHIPECYRIPERPSQLDAYLP